MNERIQELAEQAGFYFYNMHNVDGQDLGESIEADSWSAAEKFAELIIIECASIAYKSCNDGDIAAQSILYEFNIDNARQQK